MRNYQADYKRYSFNPEDYWGDYDNGKPREGYFDKHGYCYHSYLCNDGKFHTMYEHIAKWEYFNGKIPDGMEIDHRIPISNGGTNKLSNLRLVTPADNNRNPLTRKNHSEAMKGKHPSEETRIKISENRTGIQHSEETKKKISEALKGKPHNNKLKKKVYQYNLSGELINIWDSIREAAEQTNCDFSAIRNCCNGGLFEKRRNKWVKVTKHKGFKWSFEK